MDHQPDSPSVLTPLLVAEAARHQAELAAAIQRSRAIVGRSLDLVPARQRPARRISGGSSDDALVLAALTGALLCVDCVATKTGVSPERIRAVADAVPPTAKVQHSVALCERCLGTRPVYRTA